MGKVSDIQFSPLRFSSFDSVAFPLVSIALSLFSCAVPVPPFSLRVSPISPYLMFCSFPCLPFYALVPLSSVSLPSLGVSSFSPSLWSGSFVLLPVLLPSLGVFSFSPSLQSGNFVLLPLLLLSDDLLYCPMLPISPVSIVPCPTSCRLLSLLPDVPSTSLRVFSISPSILLFPFLPYFGIPVFVL